jgi:hypothetical protein
MSFCFKCKSKLKKKRYICLEIECVNTFCERCYDLNFNLCLDHSISYYNKEGNIVDLYTAFTNLYKCHICNTFEHECLCCFE